MDERKFWQECFLNSLECEWLRVEEAARFADAAVGEFLKRYPALEDDPLEDEIIIFSDGVTLLASETTTKGDD